MYCPNCKQEFTSKFCPDCGTKLVEKTQRVCPECGAKIVEKPKPATQKGNLK